MYAHTPAARPSTPRWRVLPLRLPTLPLVLNASLCASCPVPPCRYEHALSKANYASLALRPESRADEDDAGLDEDEDLYQSLNK